MEDPGVSLPRYPERGEPSAATAQPQLPAHPPGAVMRLFFLNLLAAYAPAVIWVAVLPGGADKGSILLFAPFAILLLSINSVAPAWAVLGLYWAVVLVLSSMLRASVVGRIILPACLFLLTLLQGCLLVSYVAGLNALGHS